MNSPIVNDTFRFVKWLYAEFLPVGYRDFQLDLAMELKNDCISEGIRHGLLDEQLEILALAALLHNIGCIEGQYHQKEVSKTIAANFLEEQHYFDWNIDKVLAAIEATADDGLPMNESGRIIRQLKFKQHDALATNHTLLREMGDIYP
ncbi:MAG: hypothetical protein MRY78_13220 [Saprospiraceae bacterium]|nr:hypothetical protein [Saprospiraceae bacterium]